MAEPGWYPDPARPGRARYWDGNSWAEPARRRAGRLLASAGAVLVVGTTVLTLRWSPNPDSQAPPGDVPTARPTVSAWPEIPAPASRAPVDPEAAMAADPAECPVVDERRSSTDRPGLVAGGGLAFPAPDGWASSREVAQALTDEQVVERRFGATALRSTMGVGELPRGEGFMSPDEAAHGLLECHIASSRFPSNNMGVEVLSEGASDVQGRDAWALSVDVKSIRSGSAGTVIDIVVVDLGEPGRYGAFLSVAMETNGEATPLVRAALDGLSLEG